MANLNLFLSRVLLKLQKKQAVTETQKPEVVTSPFVPYLPDTIDEDQLINDISQFFNLQRTAVEAQFREYRDFHQAQNYAQRLGERKYLCYEEAFILSIILQVDQPATVVEIGTQYGKSTRRIIDMSHKLGLDSKIVCFDIVDQVQHFTSAEAVLVLKDVTRSFREDVLETYNPGLIYLDAHPYYLLQNVISGFIKYSSNCILAIHDCSPGLCNPNMLLSKDDPNITSRTGHWERHVLAEIFGVSHALSQDLDRAETRTHRLKIFGTPHGLAVITPKEFRQRND